MLAIFLSIAAVIAIYRVAEADRGEGLKWGPIPFGLCTVALFIPIPFLPTLVAIGIVYAWMTFGKKTFY